ncbi:MAG: DUF916 and DUF3324 domain-containing protein [Oscillospiraceae bacterium]|nr:DUF916 and DUF3324 domain-containing protein [Oscillospiraceae bacterium]
MQKKARKLVSIIALVMLSAFALNITAAAMGFSVNAVLPENQRDNGSSFFDLIVYPGQEQDLLITIDNMQDREVLMLVEIITASTSRNAEINYTSAGLSDETMKFSIGDILTVSDSAITVAPETTIQVPLKMVVPDEPFEGILLGSIKVTAEPTEEEIAAGGIVNRFSHIIAVRLMQSEGADQNIPVEFLLRDVTAELTNHRVSVVARIRNPEPRIVRDFTVSAEITPVGSNQIFFEREIQNVEMAPNSIFPFTLVDEAGYGIEAGDYVARLTITHEEQTWYFEENFTVDDRWAAELKEGAINITGEERPDPSWWMNIPMWAIIAAGGGALVIFLLVILIISQNKKSKKDMQRLMEAVLGQRRN